VSEPIKLVDLVDQRLHSFLESRSAELEVISPDLGHIVDYVHGLLATGKRFRARFCYWGWRAASSAHSNLDPSAGVETLDDIDGVLALAMSLEVFHAAALVHDDIMDNSDTRRGKPSAHRAFEEVHRQRTYSGDSEHFGHSTALLVGDLLLAWSDDLLNQALEAARSPSIRVATRAEFSTMRQEVTVGQYLDIHEEAAWLHASESERLERALRVVTYKSAKYSMEAPLLIGASLAGASTQALDSLRAFGLPLGIAFQLRDDVLGVFGDSAVTGKPSGDDLREGKRTVLIALAEAAMPTGAKRIFNEMLGDRSLTGEQIEVMQETLQDSGALDKVEHMIDEYVNQAMTALEGASLSAGAVKELSRLAEAVTKRQA
jgi:geranylgeranyl diphosphate synthase, type I